MLPSRNTGIRGIPLRHNDDNLKATWCFERENNRCMPHFHQCAEVAYVKCGVMLGLVSGQEIAIRSGQIAVIPPYAPHTFSTPDSSLVIVAVIPMSFVPAIFNRFQNQNFSQILIETPPPALTFLINQLYQSCEHGSRETQQGLSQALLGLLLDLYGIEQSALGSSSDIIHQIMTYMQNHYPEDITISSLSTQLDYSASRISHLLQEQLHTTFTDYLNLLRCRHAATQILSDKKDMLEIISSSGFNSVSTFYRVFRKTYKMTPAEYVRQKKDRIPPPDEVIP